MKDRRIPYLVTDLPVPYRVRVATPSAELRALVVPKLGIQPVAPPWHELAQEVA
jgi:hypothetical protein